MQKTELRRKLQRERQQAKRTKKILLILIIILAAAYVAGVAFFRNHFYSRGSIFGIRMLGQSVERLEDEIREKIASYQLNIRTRDGAETIRADDVGLVYDDQDEVEQMLEAQNPFLWFLIPATSQTDIRLSVALDEEKLVSAMESLDCFQKKNIHAPTDAYLEFQGETYEIVPETEGNKPDHDRTLEALRTSIYAGETKISLDDLSCYVPPKIYRDNKDLTAEQSELNKLLAVTITFDFSDRKEVVDRDEISEWITLGEDFSFDLDEEKVHDYVYNLGLKYDTFGLSRTFRTHSGDTIKLRGGDYGWCIHKDKTTQKLIKLIKKGKDKTTEPVYLYEGVCRDENDLGDTYIEVSIADQTMWLYKDGECIVSTPVVTGNVSRGNGTPSGGVWAIDARISPYTLTGEDYESDVTFWLPFNGNVGIHDADWRNGRFGGSIYKTNGSHGCVNTPYAAAKKIYENVKIGDPVVIY